MISIVGQEGTVHVGDLKYKDTFIYQRNVYIRVDTCGSINGQLNSGAEVHVLKLTTGRLVRFKRGTYVTPVEVEAIVVELP